MSNNNYAFAVAHIRANENSLLKVSDMEQIIGARNLNSALNILSDKGYGTIDSDDDIETALKENQAKTWEMINSIIPDKNIIDFLLVKNDYHNIKALLKSTISLRSNANCYIEPTTLDMEVMKEALTTGDYKDLEDYVQKDLKEAYELASRTNDGQLTDVTLDRLSFKRMKLLADKTGEDFIKNLTELLIAVANIKIALRGARTKRDSVFYDMAFCECNSLDIDALKTAAIKGEDEVLEYFEKTEFCDVVEAIKDSNTAFEKWCDDKIMSFMDDAKIAVFGVAPIIAYYYAKETEIRNVRIALSCIENGLPKEKITERMRTLYV